MTDTATTTVVASVEGTTRWLRSKPDGHQCVCCDGPHVFCYCLDLIDPPTYSWGREMNLTEWLDTAVSQAPENARIRITVEIVE
jgi:hypothetical protein